MSAVIEPNQVIYSADSHVLEPANLWPDYIDPKFRDRGPHLETTMTAADGTVMEGEFLVCEGIESQPVAAFATADIDRPEDAAEGIMRGYAELRPGGWDPRQRQRDQDVDGVVFEVLYPSMAMTMFHIPDVELQQAVFQAYNSWVADYVAVAPDRFLGIAMIGLDDMDWALKELDRAHTLGLRGAMIWDDPGDKTYADLYFDPFWRAAAERNMPVSLHILTGKYGVGVEDFAHPHYLAEYLWLTHPVQRSMSLMLVSGVFERHSNLKLVSVENDIGWLPHYLQRLEHVYTEQRFFTGYELPLSPLEYFGRNCYATFQDDPVGVRNRDVIGADRVMWASDYPHADSTWPHSRETIERNFAGVSPEQVRAITRDNVAALYGIS